MLDWAHPEYEELLATPLYEASGYSRRQLLHRGATAFGGLVGVGVLAPGSALARANPAPRPIPGGLDKAFMPVPRDAFVHVLAPGIGFEMATITDFDGIVAGSETRGTAHGSDGTSYDFDTDMRFMHGTYVGLDGRRRNAAFGFIWIDLFDTGAVGDPAHQQHDFEPGIARSGLFWTVGIPTSAIEYDTKTGRARFHARNVQLPDYHDFLNAVLGGGPKPVASTVSFDVRWHGHGHHRRLRDSKFGFEGKYITGPTTVTFTAKQHGSDVMYRSVPTGQYNPTVEQMGAGSPALGHERNGVFFR